MTILKLVVKRFVLKIGYSIWNQWLSLVVFGALMVLILYLISPYECPVRRALGYPLSRSESVPSHAWEQRCEANGVKP